MNKAEDKAQEYCKGCNNFSKCDFCMNGEEWAYSEEPGSKELEKEIENFFDRWMEDPEYNQAVMPNYQCAGLEDCRNIARHFANWQKKKDNIFVSEDLEDAASSFARKDSKGINNPANFYYTVADKARIFKAGAEWQKNKMMEGAIEKEVFTSFGGNKVIKIDGFSDGDRIKIIVVREKE